MTRLSQLFIERRSRTSRGASCGRDWQSPHPQETEHEPDPLPASRIAWPSSRHAACGTFTACGGGGGDDDKGGPVAPLSQPDATADAANASATGSDTAAALDSVVDTGVALAPLLATTAAAAPDRARWNRRGRRPVARAADVQRHRRLRRRRHRHDHRQRHAGALRNGQLDAGEHYSVIYAQCTGGAGLARLNGSVEMDVTSADRSPRRRPSRSASPSTHLALNLPAGSATLDGTATVSRSVVAANGTTTTTSHVTVPSETLATAFNARNGTFTLSGLDATRTVTSVAGVVTASQYAGHHTLSGTANGRTFSMSVATTGNVSYDAAGALVSGAWTVVRPQATIATTVANGMVVITVDEGNDGTIDHTWTFPAAQLASSAG